MELSYKQKEYLQSQLWYSPLAKSPFLMKSTVYNGILFIMVTNLKSVWLCRRQKKQLMQQKQIYNKTLQVQEPELLSLLQSKLSTWIDKGKYQFTLLKDNVLKLSLKFPLNIYNFFWEFQFKPFNYDIAELVTNQIMNPMLHTIQAQQRLLKTTIDCLGNADKAKMQTQEQWKKVVGKKTQAPINSLTQRSKYILKSYTKPQTLFAEQQQTQLLSNNSKKLKQPSIITTLQQSYQNQILLKLKYEEKLQRDKKKKKKIDFI